MRKIGKFDQEKDALSFWTHLKNQSIDSTLEKVVSHSRKSWEVWVVEEDQVGPSLGHLDEFLANPNDQKFARKPEGSGSTPSTSKPKRRFKEFDLRKKWELHERRPGTITLSLIITCVAVFLLSGMGKNREMISSFFISEELFSGELWRAITPVFIHLSFLHILFNMFWLNDLGSQIERIKGGKFYVTFLLALAVISNLTQFFLEGPSFGGMSGVVYGLFGYVWIKTRFDPADGFQLDPTIAMIMFAFFILCFTGAFGGIANWAHAGGLAVGLIWGYGSAYRWNR